MSDRFQVLRLDEVGGYADPGNANVLYNLACAESRDGRIEPAIAHLTRAVELEERFAANAQDDADLVAIRGDERFPTSELT